MGLFSKKQTSRLGVDIGASSVKIVELEEQKDGTYFLKTFGSFPLQQSIIRASGVALEESIAATITDLHEKIHADSMASVTSLPGFSVFTSVVDFPELPEKDLQFAIQTEAKKYVPAPLDEVVLDSKFVEEIDLGNGSKGKRMLLIAAPRDYVDKFVHIFEKTKLELQVLEVSSFALARSLLPESAPSTAIIDVGSSTTDINIISSGALFLNRSIDKGSNDITDIIAKSMQIDVRRAEQFKKDIDLAVVTEGFQAAIPKAIGPVIDAIVGETKRVIDSFTSQYGRNVEQVVVTGGGSGMTGLSQYIQKVLNIPVKLGNPWSRVSYPDHFEKTLVENAPNFGVAVGLAMRDKD